MAFLRKHREQYWLVHNFRINGKVRQVRLYGFDLRANLDDEIQRARQAVVSRYTDQIPDTWTGPVRHKLQQLQHNVKQEHHACQMRQVRQRLADFFEALDRLHASPDDKTRLMQDCMSRLQQRLSRQSADQPTRPSDHQPASDAMIWKEETTPPLSLGQGFYLCGHTIYHTCQAPHAPPESAPDKSERAAVMRVSLINSRDLWLECLGCHARGHDVSQLGQDVHLNIPQQRISKFERFCKEHTVGESCSILDYRSGRIVRLSGIIRDIDYASRKVTVDCPRDNGSRTYQRHFAKVYFGTLEVWLTDTQRRQIADASQTELTHLVDSWYALADSSDIRLLLQQLGVHY